MEVAPDTDAAVAFLLEWEPKGPWHLTSIRVDRTGIAGRSFHDVEEMRSWIEARNGEENLYFQINPLRHDLKGQKAKITDVAALAWLHVDIDPRIGEDPNEERTRILGLLSSNLPEGVPPPTFIVDSGGGYWGFWRLKEPLALDGSEAAAEDAKLYNLSLEHKFGADSCHNIDRIARLPGTVNLPELSKRKKGRTKALSHVVSP